MSASLRPCSWCGAKTTNAERICPGCAGVMKTFGSPIDDSLGVSERGTWHPRPGGVKVWISWDEDVA